MRLIFLTITLMLAMVVGCITQKATVTNVVDGDTIDISTGDRIRLAGINTPEKGELCFLDAKLFLESKVLGKEIGIMGLGKDKYGRELAEVYLNNENINLALLREGLASAYYNDNIAWESYVDAEGAGRNGNGCMWKESENGKCIEAERVGSGFMLQNACNVTIVTTALLRDTSASHRFTKQLNIAPYSALKISEECGTDTINTIYLCQHIFNEDGDELLVYDSTGLMGFSAYGKYNS